MNSRWAFYFLSPPLHTHSSCGAFRCVFLSCLPKSLSVHFCNNNDRVGGPAGATNKERDLAWRSHCDFYFQVLESGIKTDRNHAWIMLFSLFFLPVCLRGNFASTCEYLCNTFISPLLERIYIFTTGASGAFFQVAHPFGAFYFSAVIFSNFSVNRDARLPLERIVSDL